MSVMLSNDAPIIVAANKIASRRQCLRRNQITTIVVAENRNSVEPRNEMLSIALVRAGDEKRCTNARVISSNGRVSPSSTSSDSHAKKTSEPMEKARPNKSDRLSISNESRFRSFIWSMIENHGCQANSVRITEPSLVADGS